MEEKINFLVAIKGHRPLAVLDSAKTAVHSSLLPAAVKEQILDFLSMLAKDRKTVHDVFQFETVEAKVKVEFERMNCEIAVEVTPNEQDKAVPVEHN